ncbi:MAG: hypothetical protein EXS08_14210 [Planctomycetes bacterium]|nr:hypothetical protein [Planctomycetota bacterium]
MSESNPAPVAESSRRSRWLIKPDIQLRLGAIFAGITVLCLLIQWLVFSSLLTNAAAQVPVGGEYLLDLIPTLLYRSILLSVGIALPLTMLAGVRSTFSITGPVHRFEAYLREVIRGTQLGPCKIRNGDALQELCTLINEATEPVRRHALGEQKSDEKVA